MGHGHKWCVACGQGCAHHTLVIETDSLIACRRKWHRVITSCCLSLSCQHWMLLSTYKHPIWLPFFQCLYHQLCGYASFRLYVYLRTDIHQTPLMSIFPPTPVWTQGKIKPSWKEGLDFLFGCCLIGGYWLLHIECTWRWFYLKYF